jgi:hypothetical protein
MEEGRKRMQEALTNLCEWGQKWGMDFNVKNARSCAWDSTIHVTPKV